MAFPATQRFAESVSSVALFLRNAIAAFCGYGDTDFSGAELRAFVTDCETGNHPVEPDKSIGQLLGMRVTGKESDMIVTGGATTYQLVDASGTVLCSFTFYGDLLMRPDGMYRVSQD